MDPGSENTCNKRQPLRFMSVRHPRSRSHSCGVVRKTLISATRSQSGGYGRDGCWRGLLTVDSAHRSDEGREILPTGRSRSQGCVWRGRKPSSVRVPRALGRSSIWDDGHPSPRAAYPQLRRPGPGLAAYLALLRLGVTVPRPVTKPCGGLLPHLFTLTCAQRAVCFLWPLPSPHGAQELPGSLPYGARTFLGPTENRGPRPSHPATPPVQDTVPAQPSEDRLSPDARC